MRPSLITRVVRRSNLHSGFDDVYWSVSYNRRGSGDTTIQCRVQDAWLLARVFVGVPGLERVHHAESDHLIGPLLRDRGVDALVTPTQPFLRDNSAHSVEESPVLRVGRIHIVDKFDLHRLHRAHCQHSLGEPGEKSRQKTLDFFY